jgi:hypothetical protein
MLIMRTVVVAICQASKAWQSLHQSASATTSDQDVSSTSRCVQIDSLDQPRNLAKGLLLQFYVYLQTRLYHLPSSCTRKLSISNSLELYSTFLVTHLAEFYDFDSR